jgi:DNA-binding transcriptional ArsR family regulator
VGITLAPPRESRLTATRIPPLIGSQAERLASVELDAELRPRREDGALPSRRRLTARVVHLSPGSFDAAETCADPDGWLGLLIIDGLVLIEVGGIRAPLGWLLGEDDVVRPWEMREMPLLGAASWSALTTTRIALLDDEFARGTGGAPIITRSLLRRASQTNRWLLAKSLIASVPVIEERLLLLFALFGERWGKAIPEGVAIDLPLTHCLLASLVGARRPSTTTALSALSAEGLVCRRPRGGWLLHRAVAADRIGRSACWERCATTLGIA